MSKSAEVIEPRITINLTTSGEFEIWVNEQGRDLLVRELQNLSEKWDHIHLGSLENSEVKISSQPYRADDKILEFGKVMFRTDEWDKKHFPHIFGTPLETNSN